MFNFWSFFLEKFNFTYLLVGALVLVGFGALISIPKESAPEVRIPIALVTTSLPGASAEDIEKLLTIPVEDQLASGLSEVKNITSTSREGVSVVVAEFLANADLDESIQKVKDEVDKVSGLPNNATDPFVSEVNFVDQPIVEFSVSSDLPFVDLLELADFVEKDIERISGVARVSKGGVSEREVQVIARREDMKQFDVTLSQLVGAISSANQKVPVGGLTIDNVQYAVKFEGDITDPSVVGDIPITTKGGVIVYVRDVAFVSDGLGATDSLSRLSVDGGDPQQAVSFSVFKQSGADVTRVASNVVKRIEDLKNGKLSNSETFVLFNIGDDVRDDLRQLSSSGVQTVLLVVVVLMVALGKREAILAGLAIPLSFLIAFIGLNASGNTINFVSLFSLILAVGILVDSAIVITEGIYTKLRLGLTRANATKEAVRELHWPVVAGTMTTVAVFFPLFFISGVTGKFIASIPFTIIFVLLASLFVAVALLPVFGQRFLDSKKEKGPFAVKRDLITNRLQDWYRRKLENIIGNRKKERVLQRGIIILLVFSMFLPALGFVKTIFFPGEDSDFLFIDLEQRQGTVLLSTDSMVREAESVLLDREEVDSFVSSVGGTSAFTEGEIGSNKANISVTLNKKRELSGLEISSQIRKTLEDVLPNTKVKIAELSSGPPVGAPISIAFLGQDSESLDGVANEVVQILNDVEGVVNVETSLEGDGLDFIFSVDRNKVASTGLSVNTVANHIRTALYGLDATTIRSSGEDIDVRVRLGLNQRAVDLRDNVETNIDVLKNLYIKNSFGEDVLLGSLVDVEIAQANAKIERKDQKRRVDVTANLEDGYNAREITTLIQKDMAEQLDIDDSIEVIFGGESEETNQSFMDMGLALVYGVLLIVAVLVVQFNSFRQAFIIISILPFILIGIFMGLAITRQALSFPSIMGFIAVAGIAVNNSIILIDVMNKIKKDRPDWTPKKIAVEGGIRRLRPILLTTLTTVVGVVPLTYASAIWAPLAWSIIFGLSFAVILTLVLIPVLYRKYLVRLDRKMKENPK